MTRKCKALGSRQKYFEKYIILLFGLDVDNRFCSRRAYPNKTKGQTRREKVQEIASDNLVQFRFKMVKLTNVSLASICP